MKGLEDRLWVFDFEEMDLAIDLEVLSFRCRLLPSLCFSRFLRFSLSIWLLRHMFVCVLAIMAVPFVLCPLR